VPRDDPLFPFFRPNFILIILSNKEAIVNPAMEMVAEGRFVLVLIQLIEHGQILLKMFEEAGLSASDVRFIWGETPNKIRQSAVAEFKKGAFKVVSV
jgi:superfamily II DNA or RNA helicase